VLLTLDTPYAVAALIWLGWRFFPRGKGTKRIIDWLTLIPLGFWPTTVVWALYTHNERSRPSAIWLALLLINFLLSLASMFWLLSRIDKIKIIHLFSYNMATSRGRMFLFSLYCLVIVLLLIKQLSR
jgi:hypothetical protein